jgi:hypothetical protein
LIKGNYPIYAILVLLTGGSGFNLISENAESEKTGATATKFQEINYVQDVKYDALLQRVNDLNTEVQVLKAKISRSQQ